MHDLVQHLKEYSNLVAYGSICISVIALIKTARNMQLFARNEFVKKQIQDVIELVSYLNSELINFSIAHYSNGGSSGKVYTTNIFEMKNLLYEGLDLSTIDSPLCFFRTCNQILDIKKYISNPFIPTSIVDELQKFYCFGVDDLTSEQIEGRSILVIRSKVYEENDFQRKDDPTVRIREATGFAFQTLNNFVICTALLEKSITKWLKRYKVEEINIRSYFWKEGEEIIIQQS